MNMKAGYISVDEFNKDVAKMRSIVHPRKHGKSFIVDYHKAPVCKLKAVMSRDLVTCNCKSPADCTRLNKENK